MAACLEEDIVIIDTGNKEEQIFHDNSISKALLDLSACLQVKKQIDAKPQGLWKREKNVLER